MPDSPDAIVAAAAQALTDRTRLLFFSHVLSPTGMVLPARELCALARKNNILSIVDGAHAPAYTPLRLDELACDFYGANCHKWMLAPTGSGFLYLGASNQDRLQPLQVSWGWKRESRPLDEPDDCGSTPRLRFLEFEGTRDTCPWLAVPAALDFQANLGWSAIRARIAELVRHVRSALSWLTPATPTHPDLHGAMTAFRLPPGVVAVDLRRRLWEEHRIEAPIIERPEGLLIRVSTHFYNTEAEIDRLAEALPRLISR